MMLKKMSRLIPLPIPRSVICSPSHMRNTQPAVSEEPRTPLKGVRKLDAACLLVVDLNPWRVEEHRYWRMEDAPPLEGDPATLIREQLETVSEIVIRSDVPVGIALSGGLDSSAIAALGEPAADVAVVALMCRTEVPPVVDPAARGGGVAEGLMRPFEIVDGAPSIESALQLGQIAEALQRQHLGGQRPRGTVRGARRGPHFCRRHGGDDRLWGRADVGLGVHDVDDHEVEGTRR